MSCSSLCAQTWQLLTMDQTVLPATATFIHNWNEPYLIPAFNPSHSVASLWLELISRLTEGRRLSWPGWLGEILRWFARRKTVIHPSICRGGRELNPRPSSRESNTLTTRLTSHPIYVLTLIYF